MPPDDPRPPTPPEPEPKIRVLLADDEPAILQLYSWMLSAAGCEVVTAMNGEEAGSFLSKGNFDVIVTDVAMPGADGLQVLRAARERDADAPVILMSASPTVETAMKAVEYGAFRYLEKPIEAKVLQEVVSFAARLHRTARNRRNTTEQPGTGKGISDRSGLEASFNRALATMRMAFHPIVSWKQQKIVGYEALLRTEEPALKNPLVFFEAAERLQRLYELGRAIRAAVARAMTSAPAGITVFVNLHPLDLSDDALYDPTAALSAHAQQIVLEITERASLDDLPDVRTRVAALRKMGFRIAIDDLGAGYSGLASFALLEPEVVKLDMAIVRDLQNQPTKRKLIGSMRALCQELGIDAIAEGVETADERDALLGVGCDLFQGFLFARPGPAFPSVAF
jgi:EAL domain-containing protein (putative c-di-GMP-specific phosphodiesterase class I)